MKDTHINPVLRFPEFHENWKSVSLSEILDEHKIRNNNQEYLEVFSVAKEKGVVNQIEHLGRSYASENLSNYKVVFPNDIVYTKSPTADFPFGIIKQNKTDRIGVVSVLYAVFKPETNSIGSLIDIFFSSSTSTFNYLVPLVHIGAKNTMNIGNSDFLKGEKINIPTSSKEQEKIVGFFSEIEKRLSLLREQKEKLQNYKLGVVQKLFKQKIRFKKSNNGEFPDWTEIPVSKILKRYSEPVQVDVNQTYRELGIRSHGKGIFHKEEITGEKLGNKRVFWVKEDMLILNIVFAWERAVAKTSLNEVGLIASHRFPMYAPITNEVSIDFIYHFFLSPKGEYLLKLASPGGAGRNKTLGQNEFEKLKINMPNYDEQVKIAEFLSTLDNQISNIEGQIEQTTQWKKGLLQKMFCA
ncbi:restriction endonuclease subunit S [Gaoshiqia sp. Z1-71]|uniref:restriction endonuclease subunit S n=1 Tax=Gaoshiqia hydrogeniformans TaxID=3290090 RepID=UPI003BF89597